ncbi:MAG TPA: right-handed parallel beta-helix repeat-containing protein [Thermoanaerobaculia bacterium]|nr:right-handed parallel beta-helix repeat-containing protein [Thermoanaerobaculia bacterium]
MIKQWVVVFAMAAAPQIAHAATIAGTVHEDPPALALRTDFRPLSGVTVKLYRDGGDGMPSADDMMVATTTTSKAGLYGFRNTRAGEYWVAVDSRTLGRHDSWGEQTFGPARSLCARPDGSTVAIHLAGTCLGGRTFNSDDASTLATSEHVAGVSLRDADVLDADFAFSFNVVTSTADGERVQGSLRQFVLNANAIEGANEMRFVPLAPAADQREPIAGVPLRWWVIMLSTPLPPLKDADTLLDGTAYNYLAPSSVANVHPGRVGERPTIPVDDPRDVPRQEKPELELVANGSEGIVCEARCSIRALAVRGTAVGIAVRADARLDHVIIGASPDTTPPAERGVIGLQLERGITVARFVMVLGQSNVGVFAAAEARLDAERLDVSECGTPLSGAGIALLSNSSTIRMSAITANSGAGIVIGSPDGKNPAHGNTIDGSTISRNQAGVILSPGSTRNTITRNDIMWNRLGGVTVTPFDAAPPRENRVSANRFDENGVRPIVLNLTGEPNTLARAADKCDRVPGAANTGISAPVVTIAQLLDDNAGLRVHIRGRACPGQIVEIYQSYVTSAVRDNKSSEMPRIRATDENTQENESVANETRVFALPSIGEFNYFGATNTAPDGTFEAIFPFPVVTPLERELYSEDDARLNVWARDHLTGSDRMERAFSAIAIDNVGNTSEMGVRRKVEGGSLTSN